MGDDILDRAAKGILRRSVMTQERNDITRRRESEAQHLRVFGRIDKLERSSLIVGSQERICAIDPNRRVVDVGPYARRYLDAIDERDLR